MHATAAGVTALSASAPSNGSDSAAALPSWLLIALLCLVGLVVLAMFVLTAYSLSAPRSTLKNVLGQGRLLRRTPKEAASGDLVKELALAARVGKRTTRTTLAIAAFALLGVVVIAIFGSSGQGVRDLRSQAVAAVTTLAATIAGFYFGAQTASNKSATNGGGQAAGAKLTPKPKESPDSGQEVMPTHGSVVLPVQPVIQPVQPDPENPGNAGNFQAS